MTALSVPLARPARTLRRAETAVTATLVVLTALLALLVGGRLAGNQVLVERSGSMAPAIAAGDLLLSHPVAATAVRTGDIVSFTDPLRPDVPTTHRVVALRRVSGRVAITTRGDANPAAEQWSVPAGGDVRRVALRVPRAGFAVAALSGRWTRLILLVGACAGLGVLALRRIWRA